MLTGRSNIDQSQPLFTQQRVMALLTQKIADKAVRQFIVNDDNTARQEVKLSVQVSVENLLQRYTVIDAPAMLREIDAYLSALDDNHPNKKSAIECVHRIKCHDEVYHTVTLPQLLALVWRGLHDTRLGLASEDLLLTFLNNLTKAQTEFSKDGTDCFVGTFHQVLETLDRAHPDVIIETVHISNERMQAIATAWGKQRILDILLQRNIKQQDLILTSWNDVSEKSLAQKFLQMAVKQLKHDLQKEFKAFLAVEKLAELADTFLALPKPDIIRRRHPQVIKEILALDKAFSSEVRIQLIDKLQSQANLTSDFQQQLLLDQAYQALISVDTSAANFSWSLRDYAAQDSARQETLDLVKKLFTCTYAKMVQKPLRDFPKIIKEFFVVANTLKANVEKHHQTHGAAHWLGSLQPASKLATALQHAFNENPARTLIC